MKYKFKQIAAVAMGLMTLGLTAGVGAQNYPAPFVEDGVADFAVVHGSGTGVSATDEAGATKVANDLLALATGTAAGVGSENFEIERTGNKFNLGDNANGVRDTLRKAQLENLLGDGTFRDDDNKDFDFTQKIEFSTNLKLTHFRDSDLDDVPTIGISLTSSGTEVLNYTMEFQTKPDFTAAKLDTTNIELFGQEYFISSIESSTSAGSGNKITLLDSATEGSLTPGETITLTVDGTSYDVIIHSITSDGAKLTVDGDTTGRLGSGDTYDLGDGTHVGVKEFNEPAFADDPNAFVDFSIGTGELVLEEGAEVELNGDTVEGLTVVSGSINSSGEFSGVKLQWETSDRAWVTPDHEMVLPGFETFKLSMTEFHTPSEEVTRIEDSGSHITLTAPLKGGSVTLPLLYHNESTAAIKGIGESDDKLLVTSNSSSVAFNASQNHEWFVASWEGSTDAYSEVFRVSSVNSDNETSITSLGSGTTYKVSDGSTIVAGDIEIQVDVDARVSSSDFNLTITNLASTDAGVMRNIYTADGLKIYLPYETANNQTTEKGAFHPINATSVGQTGHNNESWYLFMDEQDKDQSLAAGGQIRLTLEPRDASDETIHVNAVGVNGTSTGTTFSDPTKRIQSTDDYVGYVESELASKIDWDTSGDEKTATVTYHGEESFGRIFVSSTDTVEENGELDENVVFADNVITSEDMNKNLIVVGGSCINSVAASLVGGAHCGSDWTDATGVGSGEFLIESFDAADAGGQSGKIALLVAGYEREDTTNAVNLLMNRPDGSIDTSVGEKVVYEQGSAATATLVE
ncbi:MAG: hypothetical protein WDZ69_01085 [Candidatus Pacearchaeota archaeon]